MGWITPSISTAITLGAANSPVAVNAARQKRLNMSDTHYYRYHGFLCQSTFSSLALTPTMWNGARAA